MKTSYLKEHLKVEHRISPTASFISEIVYGGMDGIITTFTIAAGFAGFGAAGATGVAMVAVLLFGFANIFADGASMGLSSFLAARSEKQVYTIAAEKEKKEIAENPQSEYAETIDMLKSLGFSLEDAKVMADIYKKYPDAWLDFMMRYELDLPAPSGSAALKGCITFGSFVVFGVVPLVPYLFVEVAHTAFMYSTILSLAALVGLGVLRGFAAKVPAIGTIFSTVVVGVVAGCISYAVGFLMAGLTA